MIRRTLIAVSSVVLLALVAALPASAQAWKGRGRLQGKVTDESGKAVVGARVKLTSQEIGDGPEPLTTDDKGRWSILGLKGGTWIILIEADGYVTSEGTNPVSEFSTGKPVNVILRQDTGSAISLGDKLLDEGRYAEARAEFEKALPDMEPVQQARLHSRIADTYYAEGNLAAAGNSYQAALAGLPSEEQAHVLLRLADVSLKQKDLPGARERFEQVAPLLEGADRARILLQVAYTYGEEGNNAGAIGALERSLEAAPDFPEALQLIADLLIREGREVEAQTYLDRMPEGATLPPDMLLNIGIRAYNEGDMETALENFDRVVAQQSDMADAYYYRGLVYLSRGDNEAAAKDLKHLLEINPNHPKAAEAKDFLSYLEGGQ